MKEIDAFGGGLPRGFKAILDTIAATSSALEIILLICLVQMIFLICRYINQIKTHFPQILFF